MRYYNKYPFIEVCFMGKYFFDGWYKEISMSKKYKVIVKINNNSDGTAYCVKYRVDDLLKFTQFLDKKWVEWKWFDVFSNLGVNKGKQLANFTKTNRPETKFV